MPKKICLLTSGYAPNKKAMLVFLEKYLPENIEVFLFVPKAYKDKYLPLKKIRLVNTTCTKFNSFFELRKFCRKNKINRIMNLGLLPYEALVAVFASILTKTDYISLNLGNPIDGLFIGSAKLRFRCFLETLLSISLTPFPKKILLCSKNSTNKCKKYLPLMKKKIFYLPPTIPTDFFKPKNKKQIRKKLRLNSKDKIVIFIGRIGYMKGSDILLKIIKKNPDKKFILIGTIIDRKFKLIKLPNLLLINSRTQKQLIDYYNAADLCFFPSRVEGLPLVPRESMSCGTPVIISEIPSTKEIISGIRVPLNTDKMNKEINNFFNLTKKQKKQLSKKAREFIIKEYEDDNWGKEYMNRLLN